MSKFHDLLVRIEERSDIGFSSLYGTLEKAYFPRRLAGLVEIAQIRLLGNLKELMCK